MDLLDVQPTRKRKVTAAAELPPSKARAPLVEAGDASESDDVVEIDARESKSGTSSDDEDDCSDSESRGGGGGGAGSGAEESSESSGELDLASDSDEASGLLLNDDDVEDDDEDSGLMEVGNETTSGEAREADGTGKRGANRARKSRGPFDTQYDEATGEFDLMCTPVAPSGDGMICAVLVGVVVANFALSKNFGALEKARMAHGDHMCHDDPLNCLRGTVTQSGAPNSSPAGAGDMGRIAEIDEAMRKTRQAAAQLETAVMHTDMLLVHIDFGTVLREVAADVSGIFKLRVRMRNIGLPGLDLHRAVCDPVMDYACAAPMAVSEYELARYFVRCKEREGVRARDTCVGGLPLFANCALALECVGTPLMLFRDDADIETLTALDDAGPLDVRRLVGLVNRYEVRTDDTSESVTYAERLESAWEECTRPQDAGADDAASRFAAVLGVTEAVPKAEECDGKKTDVRGKFAEKLRGEQFSVRDALFDTSGTEYTTFIAPCEQMARMGRMSQASARNLRRNFIQGTNPTCTGEPKLRQLALFSFFPALVLGASMRRAAVTPGESAKLLSEVPGFSTSIRGDCLRYVTVTAGCRAGSLWAHKRRVDSRVFSEVLRVQPFNVKQTKRTVPQLWLGARIKVSEMDVRVALRDILGRGDGQPERAAFEVMTRAEQHALGNRDLRDTGVVATSSEHAPLRARMHMAAAMRCFPLMTQQMLGLAKLLTTDFALLAYKYAVVDETYDLLVGPAPQQLAMLTTLGRGKVSAKGQNWINHALVKLLTKTCTDAERALATRYVRIVSARANGTSLFDVVGRVGELSERETRLASVLTKLFSVGQQLAVREKQSLASPDMMIGGLSAGEEGLERITFPHCRAAVGLAATKISNKHFAFCSFLTMMSALTVRSLFSPSEIGAFPQGIDLVRADTYAGALDQFIVALRKCVGDRARGAVVLCSSMRERETVRKTLASTLTVRELKRVSVRMIGSELLVAKRGECGPRSKLDVRRGNIELFVPFADQAPVDSLVAALATLTTFSLDAIVAQCDDDGLRCLAEALCGVDYALAVPGMREAVARYRFEGFIHSRLYLGGMALRPRCLSGGERLRGPSLLDSVFFSLPVSAFDETNGERHVRAVALDDDLLKAFSRVSVKPERREFATHISQLEGTETFHVAGSGVTLVLCDSEDCSSFSTTALEAAGAEATRVAGEGTEPLTIVLTNAWCRTDVSATLVGGSEACLAEEIVRNGKVLPVSINERLQQCAMGDGSLPELAEPPTAAIVDVDSNPASEAHHKKRAGFCKARESMADFPLDLILGMTRADCARLVVARGRMRSLIGDKLSANWKTHGHQTRLERERAEDCPSWFWSSEVCGASAMMYVLGKD